VTLRSRTLPLVGATVAAGVLFVAGTVAAGAENPPSTPPADAGTATTVASDPTSVSTDATTTAPPPPTTTAAAEPTTTAAAPPTTTAPAPTTTAAAPRFDPWAALLAWLAAQQAARHHQQPTAGTPAGTSSAAQTASSPSTSSPSTSSSSSSSSTESPNAPAAAAPAQVAPAHLTIAGAATPGEITVGSTVTYAFTVTNTGGRATTASFNDTLPADVTPIAADADQGSCSGGQAVSCALGSIAPGQTVTVTVVVQVAQAAAFQNTISLTAGDPNAKVDSAGGPLRLQASTAAPVKLPVAAGKKKAAAKKPARKKRPKVSARQPKAAAKQPRKG
jgi:uncharacterized repeat protein (TIGR01451 family)